MRWHGLSDAAFGKTRRGDELPSWVADKERLIVKIRDPRDKPEDDKCGEEKSEGERGRREQGATKK